MRALVRLATVLLVTGACAPNPFFKIASEGNDGGASSGDDITTGDASTGDGSAGETAALVPCEPSPVQPFEQCGAPLFPFALPNMVGESMFTDVPCGASSEHYVKRTSASELQECPEGCAGACDPSKSLSVVGLNVLAQIDELLPQPGQCARLWHVSAAGFGGSCKSVGYGFWDVDGDQQLRLAASAELNPFVGLAELPIDVRHLPANSALCEIPNITLSAPCTIQNVETLTVNLGRCEFDAPQNAEWTDIPFGGRDYKFSSSSYTCLTEALPFFGWYLRRAQP
ncbi:MAG: hypothetical protein H0T76_00790 [Nannocystis sp.]|nr:hypothetical protein [Nannocystis sp.]MBA3544997.1 hypothetical protein [Nannocystis sp.]